MIFKTHPQQECLTGERCFITEIVNTAAVPDLSIARARVEPGTSTELHRLEADEYYYILEGEGMVEVGDAPEERVAKGDVVRIRAGLAQRITNTSGSDLIFLCICSPRFTPESYTGLEESGGSAS